MRMVESNQDPLARSFAEPIEPAAGALDEGGEDAAELLVEEISIDGMCGVY
jgi:mycofactocin precursor